MRGTVRWKGGEELEAENQHGIKYPMHTDTDLKSHKTSVFYLNTNNGGTIFQNGKKVISKANRLVEFDSHQSHAGVDCTDQKVRVVINFNYTKK